MESRQTFHDKMFALADRSLRGPGTPLVQAGADDFASHLTGHDLVVWPEDIGLFAALTGQRAAPARNSGSLTGAILALATVYSTQNGYYAQQFPAAAQRSLPVRLTEISLTDTFAHVAVETFAEMAQRYHVYLEAGIDMAQDWKVVCDDIASFNRASPPRLPGGVLCQEQNPQKVRQLGDPADPSRDYAYEATTDKVSNMALVFDPQGRLISKQVKSYLTPTELPGQLDLVPGPVSGLGAVHTPVGTLGFVTSKDAWMPDVQAKLDEQHVDLLVQPEFFVNDLVAPTGMWAPDTLKGAGYNDLLRMPSLDALALPELVGNVFEFSADAQSQIAVKPRRGRVPAGHLVGQPNAPGLIASPWVVPDPIAPNEPFPQRRARLGRAGQALAPGSGVACPDPSRPGPCENGHVEGVFWHDVDVGGTPRHRRYRGPLRRTRFSPARPVAPTGRPQRNAAIATRGRTAALAWEERVAGRDAVFTAISRSGGRRWSRPIRLGNLSADQQWPAIALGHAGRLTVAWDDLSSGLPRVVFAQSRAGGRRFGAPRAVDPSFPTADQWRPGLAQGHGDVVHAVWIDEHQLSADDSLPQAHVDYTRIAGGRPAPAPRRLDERSPVDLAAKLDNTWLPRVAARGRRVLVTWLGFENYDWGVFSRVSFDAGASFGAEVRVTDNAEGESQQEELADGAQPALGARTPFVAWTDWRKRDSAARAPHEEYDIFFATPGEQNRQVDPYGPKQVSTFAPSICAGAHDDAFVAFQDSSRGRSDVRVVHVRSGRRGRALLVNDAGSAGGNAWRPQLGCSGRRVTAVWEDERDGPPQIYSALANARRIR